MYLLYCRCTKEVQEFIKKILIEAKNKPIFKLFLILLFLLPINLILYKILSPRVNAFGCFDDCFNIVAGYFMLDGKTLYSQIFFNHQMLMADISYVIQTLSHPINIYELVLRHRQFIMLIGLIMDGVLIYRFGLAGVGFTLFYEFSKFYIFGDRFLGEGLVVYFLAYILGLLWYKLNKNKLYLSDYILAGIFTWAIIFLRETFIPVAIFTYFLILFNKNEYKNKIISVVIFLILTLGVILLTPIKDYIFQVLYINLNLTYSIREKADNPFILVNQLKIFLYPLYLYIGNTFNNFRYFILGLNTLFIISLILYIKSFKKLSIILLFLFLLGLTNIRPVTPGTIFYGAFHMLPWYGSFILLFFLVLQEIKKQSKKFVSFASLALFLLFTYLILAPNSYIREKADSYSEFINNYGNILQLGEVIRALSKPEDTLFLDGGDDLIYWQAKLHSNYKYSWYMSLMPMFPVFTNARAYMFANDPPDFYYDLCTKGKNYNPSLPKQIISKYQQLYSFGKPTCVYVKKTKIPQISTKQWQKAKEFKYELPKDI